MTPSPAARPSSTRPATAARQVERFVLRLLAHNAFETAAAVAFWFFLSLVPLLVLAGYLVGQVARARGVDALVGPLLEVVPGTAEDLIRSELERLAGARGTSVAPLGVVGFLWTASSGLHNLMEHLRGHRERQAPALVEAARDRARAGSWSVSRRPACSRGCWCRLRPAGARRRRRRASALRTRGVGGGSAPGLSGSRTPAPAAPRRPPRHAARSGLSPRRGASSAAGRTPPRRPWRRAVLLLSRGWCFWRGSTGSPSSTRAA